MSDLEQAFLKHLGNTFVPYVGREEGLPKPEELIAFEKEEQRKKAEQRRIEKERRRQQQIAQQRAAIEELAKRKTLGSQVERVMRAVCAVHGITQHDLIKADRSLNFVKARHHVMWLLRDRLGMGWSEIGRTMARDHGTVISNVTRFRKVADTTPEVKEADALLGDMSIEEGA